jgi:hypothetical protein
MKLMMMTRGWPLAMTLARMGVVMLLLCMCEHLPVVVAMTLNSRYNLAVSTIVAPAHHVLLHLPFAAARHKRPLKDWHWFIDVVPYTSRRLPCIGEEGPRKTAHGDQCTSWGSEGDDYAFSSFLYKWLPHNGEGHDEEPESYGKHTTLHMIRTKCGSHQN